MANVAVPLNPQTQQWNFLDISAAATTVVKTGEGCLHSIIINATAASTITVYDNTAASGTKIATLKASIGEATYYYDVKFYTGLTVITAGNSDFTVTYA